MLRKKIKKFTPEEIKQNIEKLKNTKKLIVKKYSNSSFKTELKNLIEELSISQFTDIFKFKFYMRNNAVRIFSDNRLKFYGNMYCSFYILETVDGFIQSDVIQSDVIQSDVIQSDVIQSDVVQSDVVQSDVIQSDVVQSDVVQSDVVKSEVVQSDIKNEKKTTLFEGNKHLRRARKLMLKNKVFGVKKLDVYKADFIKGATLFKMTDTDIYETSDPNIYFMIGEIIDTKDKNPDPVDYSAVLEKLKKGELIAKYEDGTTAVIKEDIKTDKYSVEEIDNMMEDDITQILDLNRLSSLPREQKEKMLADLLLEQNKL